MVAGTVALGVSGLLAAVMAGEGAIKLGGADSQVEGFRDFGYPQWFRLVVGGLELAGAIALGAGLLTGTSVSVLVGGAIVAVVLAGAVGTHVRVGDSLAETAPAAALLVVCLGVMAYHGGVLG